MEYTIHLQVAAAPSFVRQIFLKYAEATVKALSHADSNEFVGLLEVRFPLIELAIPRKVLTQY